MIWCALSIMKNYILKSRVSVKKWIFIYTVAKTPSQPRRGDTILNWLGESQPFSCSLPSK